MQAPKEGLQQAQLSKEAPGQAQEGKDPLCSCGEPPHGAKPHLFAADLRLQRAASLWSLQPLSWAPPAPARAPGQGLQQGQALAQGPAQGRAQARGLSRALARPVRCGRGADPGPGSALAHLGGMARAAAPGRAQGRAAVPSWVYVASQLVTVQQVQVPCMGVYACTSKRCRTNTSKHVVRAQLFMALVARSLTLHAILSHFKHQ